MVVRMVAQVIMDSMESRVLYPPEEESGERVALLTGIVQLVSTALERARKEASEGIRPEYMKSDKGTVGYLELQDRLYICEADNEKEAGSVLDIILDNINASEANLELLLQKALRKRGKEISSLWG